MNRTTNINSGFVCHCARIRHSELLEIFSESSEPSYENFKRQYGIGDQCGSCEYEVKAILDEFNGSRVETLPAPRKKKKAAARPAKPRRKRPFADWLERRLHPKVNVRACMFFIRTAKLRSSLVVSNVSNPESNVNPNRGAVWFRILLYDQTGALVRESRRRKVAANETLEISNDEIAGRGWKEFLGSVYVEYFDLECTYTLRPYCVLSQYDAEGVLRSRQHYHDKFYSGMIPGFVQTPSALVRGRECWPAMVNCSDDAFEAEVHLRVNDAVKTRAVSFEPRSTVFLSVTELFSTPAFPPESVDSHLWIESPHYVMSYFFWHDQATGVWFGQHH